MSTFNLFQKLVVGLVAVFNGGWHPAPPTRRVEMVRCESQSGWVGEEGGGITVVLEKATAGKEAD